MRAATADEIANWDQLIQQNPDGGQIMQSRLWAEFKSRWGWQPEYLIGQDGDTEVAVLSLHRNCPGLGKVCYIPKGPGVISASQLLEVIPQDYRPPKALLLKIEPEIEADTNDIESWTTNGWQKAPWDVQISRATILLDIRKSDEDLLASFKPKTRYNIRLAKKKGVIVKSVPTTPENLQTMYKLVREALSRANFMVRSKEYYCDFWLAHQNANLGQLFFASYQDQVLAGIFVTHFGKRGWYKDGGSIRAHSELMAPYLLQWEAMHWLTNQGVTSYDLVGVPRPAELNERHPMYGLQRFKSGFSQTVTEFVGTWDFPYSARKYGLWNHFGEKVVSAYSQKIHHNVWY